MARTKADRAPVTLRSTGRVNLFSLAIPKGVLIRELAPVITVAEVLRLREYRNPVIAEARLVQQAQAHRDRLEAIFAEQWGQS